MKEGALGKKGVIEICVSGVVRSCPEHAELREKRTTMTTMVRTMMTMMTTMDDDEGEEDVSNGDTLDLEIAGGDTKVSRRSPEG